VQVFGISQNAAIIHIVVLTCTSGASLPFNLAFCFWHAQRYDKSKKERASIRQILGGRKVKYQGKGKWVDPAVTDMKVQLASAYVGAAQAYVDNNCQNTDQQSCNNYGGDY
jgi:hypothetical protein